ncbi:MucBP domain-containing protein [Enterococcus sp. DIV0187]|uniref:MucBP domain-containing protein n=1 Tax=Enterococcus sp. DIV0187 TaxID=2774644 RepID=UPI003F1F5384
MKKNTLIGLGLGMLCATTFAFTEEVSAADMHRLYNPNSGEHFYTANSGEKNNLTKVGWRYEGIGWTAPNSGTAVYRLYNKNAGDHHYTLNLAEKNHLVKVGWKYEGIGWYSDTKKAIPLYRAYNPNAKAGSHNYTTNYAEQKNLLKVGWRNEGIAWYGVSKTASTPKPAVQKYTVVVKHVGSDSKVLKTSNANIEKGKSFTARAENFNGYTLKGNNQQTVTVNGNKTITFNYTKNAVPVQKFKVSIQYKEKGGKLLTATIDTATVEKGKQYTATARTFSGYKVEGSKTQTITVNRDTTITFNYLKDAVKVDKTALIAYYNDLVKNTVLTDYTKDSQVNFNQSTSSIKVYYIDKADVTQKDVDAALANLKTLKSKLVYIKTLKLKIDEANKIIKGNKTDASWSAFQTNLTNAKTILNKASATQKEVDTALINLTNAISNLKDNPAPEVNKTALQQAISKASAISKGNYTDASWNNLQTVLTNSKNTYNNANVTQAQVDQATTVLNQAINNLQVKPTEDLTTLQNQVNQSALTQWNQHRASYGKTQVSNQATLQAGANLRAREIAQVYDHYRPSGYDSIDGEDKNGNYGNTLSEEIGYIVQRPHPSIPNAMLVSRDIVGENIAKVYDVDIAWIKSTGATYAIQSWKNSSAHNNIMLTDGSTRKYNQGSIGTFIEDNGNGTYNVYYVLLLGYDTNL